MPSNPKSPTCEYYQSGSKHWKVFTGPTWFLEWMAQKLRKPIEVASNRRPAHVEINYKPKKEGL